MKPEPGDAGRPLPAGLCPYARTADFTETTIPAALLRAHTTKAGAWALIHVLEGRLTYRIKDPRRPATEEMLTPQTPPGVVEPTILHEVEPLGAVRFYVEFHRLEKRVGEAPDGAPPSPDQ